MKEISHKVVKLLKRKKLKISFAESCTGGMLSSAITSINGSSKVFNLVLITYSNESKVNDLDINLLEPYIQIQTVNSNGMFIANKAKTYEEEKRVANKAPVENITIKNISLSNTKKNKKKIKKINSFNYIIKFADLYFEDSAILLKKRLNNEFNINNVFIKELNDSSFRVYLGPFKNLESIKKKFNDIGDLNFENIEIIKL